MKRILILSLGLLVLALSGIALFWHGRSHPTDAKIGQRRILYYVDPMHPSYRSDKPGIAPDCGMALEPVYDDAGATSSASTSGAVTLAESQQRLIGIRVETVRRIAQERTLRTTGRVVADENHLYRLQAGFDGWVESLNDNPPGTLVHKDEELATLYGPEIRNLETNYLGFVSGVERLKQSSPDSDTKTIEDSGRINEEQLRLVGMGDDQIKELRRVHRPTSVVRMVSPGDGVVLTRAISPKQRFMRGTELYRIADLRKVWIVADAHGGDGDWKPGMRVQVHVPELSRTFAATVTATTPLFDESSRTLKVRLEAENPGLQLRPDMFVDVDFESKTPPGLTVPAEAVVDSGMHKIVYVETQDGVFEPRRIEIGDSIEDRVVVMSGIQEGERVVVSGNFLLDSETRMRSAAQEPAGVNRDPAPAVKAHD